jgi:hypothetical protein
MTKDEAKRQMAAFFRRLGEKKEIFGERNFVKARVGEAFLGFEYDETDGILSCQALIYRFRREPRDEILDAAFAEENRTGGGRVVFDSQSLALYLQRDYAEKTDDAVFDEEVRRLAADSLVWSGEILGRLAENVAPR